MVVTGVVTSGQWGYPIQGLGSYGGAEEKKPSFNWFTSEQIASLKLGSESGVRSAPVTTLHLGVRFDQVHLRR